MSKTLEQTLTALIDPAVADMGFDLVRAAMMDVNGRRTLQVMIERQDHAQINVDDCAEVSHVVSAILDVEDPISGAYHLEVSSPGIDRPLTKIKHFDRFSGFDARVEFHHLIDGRRKAKGKITAVEGDTVTIQDYDGVQITFGLADLHRAKLLLTDELMAATEQGKHTH